MLDELDEGLRQFLVVALSGGVAIATLRILTANHEVQLRGSQHPIVLREERVWRSAKFWGKKKKKLAVSNMQRRAVSEHTMCMTSHGEDAIQHCLA